MKLKDNIGINPLYWGAKPLEDFVEYFKDKAEIKKLEDIHEKCVDKVKKKNKSPRKIKRG